MEKKRNLLTIIRGSHPALADKIELLWGEPELISFLDSLMVSDRENREGFSPLIFSALFMIQQDLSSDKSECGWDRTNYR